MSATKRGERSAGDITSHVELLMRMLAHQFEAYKKLLSCIEQKRQAIRSADIDGIMSLCKVENTIVRRIGDIEKKRLALVGRITGQLAPDADKPLSPSEIGDLIDEPQRTELTTLAAQLRETVLTVRKESSIVKSAADALSLHMSGIMQTINSALSRVGVYERRGRISVCAQMEFCVDLKS